ncbi:hypothetical protein BXO88_07910 [Oribacterium sp. C9]|uniref:DHHW family protein n=1 Tax=Oribacterium sp. C9 TaxID=1943579 RepID=UPI00098F43D9|nr:DHHW family protein [Oribacterium sp. C9]OON86430.1 hypothetical protein BXO88_07910 [Oribacterium sp. C9]
MIEENEKKENRIGASEDFEIIRKLASSLNVGDTSGAIEGNGEGITETESEESIVSDTIGADAEGDIANDSIEFQENETIVEESTENNAENIPVEVFSSENRETECKNGTESVEHEEKTIKSYGALFMTGTSLALFAGIFLVGTFATRPVYSESEKRTLAKKPEFSMIGAMNGSYFTELDKWFSDTFPFKEELLNMESKLESFYGAGGESYYGNKSDIVEDTVPENSETLAPIVELKPREQEQKETEDIYQSLVETNADGTLKVDTEPKEKVDVTGEQAGNIYVSNNKAYEIFYYNQGGSVKYASVLNTVKSMLPDSNVYDILVPNSFGVELDPSLQEELGSGNMQDVFNYIFSMMDPNIHRLSVFDTLYAHRDEYVFFNTDHHWTGLGAYYAYREFCKEKGITPHELGDFKYVDYSGFYGTFYFATNRNESLKSNPDHVEAWIPMGTNEIVAVDENGLTYNANVINDVTESNAGRKYNCFLKGDNAFTTIKNPEIKDGSSCVVIKESYGNAFVPFLVDHYEDVYVVDYRYYKDNLTQFILDNKIQDVIFVNNVQAITEKVSDEILSIFS